MGLGGLFGQLLNGLAEASALFMVAAGLSLIFGVSRIVNFAHGSLYMLGIYLAYTLVERLGAGPAGFWASLIAAALITGAVGALIEVLLLRRVYRAPELFQLLATFALVLLMSDAVLWLWGPEDLLGRRAPGLAGAVTLFGRATPSYNLVLIAIGPLVLVLLWLLLLRTRWGMLVRAATQDRDMLGALGVNQAWLFTSVFALGAALAGLGGALQLPREPASLSLDLAVIGDAFVVVVVGGMGSIPGACLAALLIAEIKAVCVGLGTVQLLGMDVAFPKLTLVAEFLVMAVVLVCRPWGLLGRPQAAARGEAHIEPPLKTQAPWLTALGLLALAALILLPRMAQALPYAPVLAQDVLISVIFAASLHFMMGPGGMASFGHAAFLGLGAYGAGLLFKATTLPMPLALAAGPAVAGLAALAVGWFCVRLSGVYLAMLTLAFAQIAWSVVYQWNAVTGGSNGMIGVWPPSWMGPDAFYYLVLAAAVLAVLSMRRALFAPFGLALRAARDSALRAEAIGIDARRVQWMAFVVAGAFGGLAGALHVFAKGGAAPEVMGMGKSVDALVMVLLGGIQSLSGPIVGAAAFNVLQDAVMRATDYWRAVLGAIILLLVLVFPHGLAGFGTPRWRRGK